MKCFLALYITTLFAGVVNAQTDTISNKVAERWPHFFPGIRVGVGLQKAFYYEAGLSMQRFAFNPQLGFAATSFYAAYTHTTAMNEIKAVNGVKAGIESVFNGGTCGIEVGYLSDSNEDDIVITPKLGLGSGT